MNKTNADTSSNSGIPAVIGTTFDEGRPQGEGLGKWSYKLESREEIIKYLQTGQRYFYSQDWFGREKRKTPA